MKLSSIIFIMLTPLWISLFHALINRLGFKHKRSPQRVALLASLWTVGFVYLTLLKLEGGALFAHAGSLFFAGLVPLLLAHVYFHLFNMSETARRIKILVEVKKGNRDVSYFLGGHKASSYNNLIQIRLERLKDLGQVTYQNNRYYPKKCLLAFATIVIKSYAKLLYPERFKKTLT